MDNLHLKADCDIHTFVQCKTCVLGQQTERLEAGISRTGVAIRCKKHGLVAHFSPEELLQQLARGPQCHCCPGGMHRS